ncbi:hypothetical protein [Marinicrinis lubricantis]|uniref:Uncharacterized protein n=1 Tax=Marinicrinis lubricantis TaxID=2086470 RepID=A0ABW1INZ0_9BACL
MNLQINEYKEKWLYYNNIYIREGASSLGIEALTNRNIMALKAQQLRNANTHLSSALLTPEDTIQIVYDVDYKTHFIGGSTKTSQVRVDNKGNVYYPLPAGAKEMYENITILAPEAVEFSKWSKEAMDYIAEKNPLANMLNQGFQLFFGEDVQDFDKLNAFHIEQDGHYYRAVFYTKANQLVDYTFWDSAEFLNYRLPDFIYDKKDDEYWQ